MECKLLPVTLIDKKPIWDMLQEIPKEENGFQNDGHGIPFSVFQDFLLSRVKMANAIDLKAEWVPQQTYWFYIDDKPVGFSKLRTRLTVKLIEHGGNLGYCIRPSERKKRRKVTASCF